MCVLSDFVRSANALIQNQHVNKMIGGFNHKSYQGSRSNRGKVVSVAIVGATASSRDGLGLVHLWLVRIIIDIVLTLRRRTQLKNHTNEESKGSGVL